MSARVFRVDRVLFFYFLACEGLSSLLMEVLLVPDCDLLIPPWLYS